MINGLIPPFRQRSSFMCHGTGRLHPARGPQNWGLSLWASPSDPTPNLPHLLRVKTRWSSIKARSLAQSAGRRLPQVKREKRPVRRQGQRACPASDDPEVAAYPRSAPVTGRHRLPQRTQRHRGQRCNYSMLCCIAHICAYRPFSASKAAWLPRSMMRPASITRISCASTTVDKRCAITRVVLFCATFCSSP